MTATLKTRSPVPEAIDALAGEWPIRVIDRSVGNHSREVTQAIHSPSFHRPEWPSTYASSTARPQLLMDLLKLVEESSGESVGIAMKLTADNVQSLVIPAAAISSSRRLPRRCWQR
jgi:hypothetical protein